MSAEKAGLRVRLSEVRFQPSFSLESTLLGQFRLSGFRSLYVEFDRRKKAAGYFFSNLANSSRDNFIASAFCSAVISFSMETRPFLAFSNPCDPAMFHHA